MRGRAAAACVALVAGWLLSGCGGGGGGGSAFVDHVPLPPDTMTTRMDEPGHYGGRFVAGATSSAKTFNPIMANETSSAEVNNQLFVSLGDIDYRTQDDIPILARSWEFSNGGRTVTYHLRRGARFSDGHPLTSEDVKFCFDVVMDPTLHPSMQDALFMEVGGKKLPFTYSAPDSYTFVVTAPATDALILSHVANVRILPKHILEPAYKAGHFASSYTTATPPESLVTSGPWRLKQHIENQQTVLTRNPYWLGVDAQGRRLPYLDELVFRVAKDQDVAGQMFRAGELDGLDNVKAEDYKQYADEQKEKGFVLYDTGPSFNTSFFWFNLNRVRKSEKGKKVGDPKVGTWKFALFSNRDFRRAVSMAVDRDAIIHGPYYGYGGQRALVRLHHHRTRVRSRGREEPARPARAQGQERRRCTRGRGRASRGVHADLQRRQQAPRRDRDAAAGRPREGGHQGHAGGPRLQHDGGEYPQRVRLRRLPAGPGLGGAVRSRHGAQLLEVERPHALLGRRPAQARHARRGADRRSVPVQPHHDGPRGAQARLPRHVTAHERRVLRDLAADAAHTHPGARAFRERAPEPDAAPHPLELRRPVRQASGA